MIRGPVEAEPDFDMVVRLHTIGRHIGYTEKEIWHMTPRKIQILFEDYQKFNNPTPKETQETIDFLP